MPDQFKSMTSRRDILRLGAVAVAGGCAGGLATFAVDRALWHPERQSDTTGLRSPGASRERLSNSFFVHDFSDGSGSAANDEAAITAAFAAAARSSWSKPIVFTRSFKCLSEHEVPHGAAVEGIQPNTILRPQTALRSVFRITGGQVTIRNLSCAYPRYLSTNSLPCDFIRVDKPWNNYPVRLEKLSAYYTRNIVRWVDGDAPQIDDIYGINNIRALHFENNGMNGRIANIYHLGGGGLYLGRNTAAAKPQQMEGTTLSGLRFLPADLGPDGAASGPGLEMHAGLALRFYDMLIDQVFHFSGAHIDASTYSIDDIEIYGLWLGGSVKIASNTSGLIVEGSASRIHVYGGKIAAFPRWGAIFNKTRRFLLDGIEMKLNGTKGVADGGDLLSIGSSGTVRSCDFSSTTRTVNETDGSQILGDDNFFAPAAIPASVARSANWQRSLGPGAPS